jgi:uncharacterized protein YukJ
MSNLRAIKPMPATPGTTTHLDLIDKINEIIDRVNYLANTPLYYEGEPMENWRKIQEAGGKYDPNEEKPYSTFKRRRTDE